MEPFILNNHSQPNGDFEVHRLNTCDHLPLGQDWLFLGNFSNCQDALNSARVQYPHIAERIDGCYYCCNNCHIR